MSSTATQARSDTVDFLSDEFWEATDGMTERSTIGKSERRRAKKAKAKENRRQQRRERRTGHHQPSPSTHRLVGISSTTCDDLAWEHKSERGFRAAFVGRRDRDTIALALDAPARAVHKFAPNLHAKLMLA